MAYHSIKAIHPHTTECNLLLMSDSGHEKGDEPNQKKRKRTPCPHGNKHKYSCRQCGGSNFCDHGRQKHQCKECGGRSICEHSRQRHQCKDCKGSSICEHDRIRSQCKDCNPHRNSNLAALKKALSKDTSDSRLEQDTGQGACDAQEPEKKKPNKCPHGKQKSRCIDCGGQALCEHKVQRYFCKKCNGGRYCDHGKQKHLCIECDGSAMCEHRRQRNKCKDCKGSAICKHGKDKARCNECLNFKCEHGQVEFRCKQCELTKRTATALLEFSASIPVPDLPKPDPPV